MSYLPVETMPMDISPQQPYQVNYHKKAKRYIEQRIDPNKWNDILLMLSESPKWGNNIAHMKHKFHCNHRLTTGRMHRIMYTVSDKARTVLIFKAGPRGSVYR